MQQLGLRTELASLCLALWAIGGASGRLKCQPEGQPSKLSLPARLALLRCPPDGKQQPDKHQPGYPGWWAQLARLPFWLALWVAGGSSAGPASPLGTFLVFACHRLETGEVPTGLAGLAGSTCQVALMVGTWGGRRLPRPPKCQPKGQPSKLSPTARLAWLALVWPWVRCASRSSNSRSSGVEVKKK